MAKRICIASKLSASLTIRYIHLFSCPSTWSIAKYWQVHCRVEASWCITSSYMSHPFLHHSIKIAVYWLNIFHKVFLFGFGSSCTSKLIPDRSGYRVVDFPLKAFIFVSRDLAYVQVSQLYIRTGFISCFFFYQYSYYLGRRCVQENFEHY